jgi:hypothetical protein
MTKSCTILQVATHSTLVPIHGGQLRSHNIGRVLEAAGFTVRGIAACFRQDHDIDNDREAILDMWTAVQSWKGGVARGAFGDYFLCITVEENPTLRARFFNLAEAVRPDIVLLEHPWLWPLVRLIPAVAEGKVPVVYDSQNVEAHLKERIVEELQLDAGELSRAEVLLSATERLEQDLVTKAAAVTACTTKDAQVFEAWGARLTVVAGNGSYRRPTTGLQRPLPSLLPRDCRYALMVGSEHQPNITGFENLVLPFLALLRSGQRVVAAGGASEAVRRRLAEQGASWALEGRLTLLGKISDLALSALMENAGCIIIPIEYGGGSNIKTAEALLTDCRVVASPVAMRGFDQFLNVPGLTVADGPEAFGMAVRAALADNSPPPPRAAAVAALTWDAMLAPLVALVGDLTGAAR